ncbi:MAG: biotin--[acetyl-CoA-carboxylase] ligase [Candidatus Omnitrophica bacterium]|nr:biotin--[acetyl-CoA-carboxylase] ligase [Candidatus Omnitrophota bacterium]MDD5574070.1 biotin--[acetyl-CoA-carboxylase] ligase [Candidatus Omnitrophota bacterium]
MDTGLSRLFHHRSDKRSLGTRTVGTKVLVYDVVTSTNDLALFLAENGEPPGTILFAHSQTHGRGRLGNTWSSPHGKGIYCSLILRPDIEIGLMPLVTLTAALAVVSALKAIHVGDVSIKWPNDVYAGAGKIAGILTEMHLEGGRPGFVIVGIGLNVNNQKDELPVGAASVRQVLKREFDIADLFHIIIKDLDRYYTDLLEGRTQELLHKIKEASGLVLGERVRVENAHEIIEGYAVDFEENGSLVIRLDNGCSRAVHAGHLTTCAKNGIG